MNVAHRNRIKVRKMDKPKSDMTRRESEKQRSKDRREARKIKKAA